MGTRLYISRLGETIGGLYVSSILRFVDNEPLYSCKCLECGSTVPIAHRLFRQGNARCTSSIHGHVQTKPATSSSSQVGIRSDGWAEHYAEMLKPQEEPPPGPDPEIAARKAKQAAENQRRTAELRRQHHKYFNHCLSHNWPMDKAFTFAQWCSIDDDYRGQILERQASGYYEKDTQEGIKTC
jgi:hypothetical protein